MAGLLAVLALTGADDQPFRDPPDGPEMVVIPSGGFEMGTDKGEAAMLGFAPRDPTLPWQQPKHTVVIAHEFALATTPITVAQYQEFAVDAGEKIAGAAWLTPGIRQTDQDPVVNVSWKQAKAYASWLAAQTGQPYRLPTEAEWEYAARAGTATERWWGDEAGVNRMNCDDCGSRWDGAGTSPVRSFAANRFGLSEMLGTVSEWTQDCWNPGYAGAPGDGSAWMSGDCALHPTRGGSWSRDSRFARAAQRDRDAEDGQDNMIGFRVARDLP
jgi:formylglycine-generating enzyme required for sulfatase activity